jgi:AraC-like DNA-binding protein
MRGQLTAIGAFRCPVEHPLFRDSGPIQQHLVVFPRRGVRIRHEGQAEFIADPNVVTIYNRAQRYERWPISPDGDRCEWFGVSDAVAREIVAELDPAAAESDRPFRFAWTATTATLYLRQRTLLRAADRGEVHAPDVDELVMHTVATVLALAYRQPTTARARRSVTGRRQRELAEAARMEIGRAPERDESPHSLAARLDTTPYHLCRVFRAALGQTMHRYRTELRLRRGLELLEDRAAGGLSRVALELGFASHSHFVRAVRQHFGTTPSLLRTVLRA